MRPPALKGIDGRLIDWSKSMDVRAKPDYSALKPIALEFLALSSEDRRAEVAAYSQAYCSPDFHLREASGLYLFLRVVFDLPQALPRDRAKVFGSWLHPSISRRDEPFDLSWPVTIDVGRHLLLVSRMRGVREQPYDGIGEYDYFVKNFSFRDQSILESIAVRPANQ